MKRKFILIAIVVLAVMAGIFIYLQGEKKEKQTAHYGSPIPIDSTAELWFKHALIYTLDIEVFQDSDGDGTGDINGLIQRLGYIDSLGADVIWLAPFQPTPNKDDGYDVTDYYSVDTSLGTMADFQQLIHAANQKGIRIIMDLVLNHTSEQHPWFQQAKRSQASPYHSWYVWSKEKPKNSDKGMVFPGVQQTIWTFDSSADAYYYHRFYHHQPDLNAQNNAVQAEIKKIIKHWIDRGIAGFRLDAVPFLIEVPQTNSEKFEHQFDILYSLRRYIKSLRNDAIILGEANVPPKETKVYFGEQGQGMQLMFNFFVNQHLFYALATGDTKPLKDALTATGDILPQSQWGQFLRNHDEVDLARLSNSDRKKVYEAFGPEPYMQLYDRGIRRRLPPMMDNNRKHLEVAYSLLFSLPSTPVIRYGDEIGMGDDLSLQERLSVRTPMQWSAQPSGGFSSAVKTVRPVIDSGVYGYQTLNVKQQQKDSLSLLTWTKRVARLRKQCPEISYGSWKLLDAGSPHVLAMQYNWQGRTLTVLHNLSESRQEVNLSGIGSTSIIKDMWSSKQMNLKEPFRMEGYSYYWLEHK